jgi:hypothetical protein
MPGAVNVNRSTFSDEFPGLDSRPCQRGRAAAKSGSGCCNCLCAYGGRAIPGSSHSFPKVAPCSHTAPRRPQRARGSAVRVLRHCDSRPACPLVPTALHLASARSLPVAPARTEQLRHGSLSHPNPFRIARTVLVQNDTITPLQKGQGNVAYCVCTKCTHNMQRPFTLFAGYSYYEPAASLRASCLGQRSAVLCSCLPRARSRQRR